MADRSSPLRTVVVDDSASFRSLLADYLESEDEFEVVGTAGDGAEAERVIDLTDPDLVILDVHLPQTDGLAVLDDLRERHRHTLFALTSSDDMVEFDAMERGADLYVDKLTPFDELCESILFRDSASDVGD